LKEELENWLKTFLKLLHFTATKISLKRSEEKLKSS
jgi:hypothetical protein